MTTIPDAAIEAAAEALQEAFHGDREPPNKPCSSCMDQGRAAIEAAMPAIREAIAQEIEAEMADVMDDDGDAVTSVYIVRGGTP